MKVIQADVIMTSNNNINNVIIILSWQAYHPGKKISEIMT